jgi:SAM-dependent methyltransferase
VTTENTYDYSIYYSQFHEKSDEHAEKMAAWTADLLAPHVPSDLSINVLDVGCGFGFALRAVRKLGFTNVAGIEISAQQAAVASAAGFAVEVTEDTEGFLKSRPASYGFIMLMDVLEHIPVEKQIDLLKAIHNALIPGGRLFVSVPNANAMLASRWRYNDFTHYSSFTEHSLDFVMKNAGFSGVWIDDTKGIGRLPLSFWRRSSRPRIRKWLVRWAWLQVHKAELSWMNIDHISFELNLHATADKA